MYFSFLVIGIISAVTAGFSVLKAVASQIDVSRVCAIGLSNHGNRKLVEPSWYLESGIIRDPLPREILPGDAGIFTFEKTNCEYWHIILHWKFYNNQRMKSVRYTQNFWTCSFVKVCICACLLFPIQYTFELERHFDPSNRVWKI